LSGEQESEWRRHNKKWDFGLKRRDSELPWYHPNNDYFWRQISDIRISAKTTVLVFLGSALQMIFDCCSGKDKTLCVPPVAISFSRPVI
jgi:hypothetical protein